MSYAIFKAAGQQFRAEKGLMIKLPLLKGEPGSKLTFEDVLLSSDGEKVRAGAPMVKGAKVVAEIVRHGKADKITVFKFKRRSNYRRKTGHRQQFTEVKITDVKIG